MTFRDNLLLEQAYMVVLEQKMIELCHAADKKDLDSFIKNGIQPERAGTRFKGAGARQGKGFYLFRGLKPAQIQGRGMYGEGKYIIIVIAVNNLDPNNFDIDYEIDGHQALRVLRDLCVDSNRKIDLKKLKLAVNKKGDLILNKAWYNLYMGDRLSSDKEVYPAGAEALNNTFMLVQKYYPDIYNDLERKLFYDNGLLLQAVKYNGSERIWPTRIEDSQGNIIWSK